MRGTQAKAALAAAALALAGSCAALGPREALKGEWSKEERAAWYAGTQGSRLVPWTWAQALERAEDTQLFFGPENLARLGYVRNPVPTDPRLAGLPIGFALDDHDDSRLTYSKLRWFGGQGAKERWLGLNCAACHTGQIAHDGSTRIIDGGPSITDYQQLVYGFDAALAATAADPARYERFAAKVLAGKDTPANRAALKTAFASLIAWEARQERANHTTSVYGPARVDAFGRIFNKVAVVAGPDDPRPNPSDAPVSFPFLWQTSQSDIVQWNGIAANTQIASPLTRERFDYGALGRNTGEMIGVFGDVNVQPRTGGDRLKGYPSSLDADSIIRMEGLVARLRAPAWPTDWFGKPDATLAAEGDRLFQRDCVTCHQEVGGRDVSTPYKASMQWFASTMLDPGTDRSMACNAATYTARSGNMAGLPDSYVGSKDPLPASAPVAALLRTVVVGTLVGDAVNVAASGADVIFGVPGKPRVVHPTIAPETREQRMQRCARTTDKLLAYKARPLAGIWATAPYLHNGSVPTLYDLLLPPEQRPATFRLGTREYDPVKIGYRADAAAPGNAFVYDTSLPGNRNIGHDYGNAKLSDEERRALVEYLKTI